MYQLLLVDQNVTIRVQDVRPNYELRVPSLGEHVLVRWNDQTKICEVEDVWTNFTAQDDHATQGAVQVLVRWSHGIDPALYVRRFR